MILTSFNVFYNVEWLDVGFFLFEGTVYDTGIYILKRLDTTQVIDVLKTPKETGVKNI